ncbi:Glycosyl transferase family 11 [Trinorchestia longiramus]|nr:Glycosyl transferase family 11 [Trinorchestia longiramus]
MINFHELRHKTRRELLFSNKASLVALLTVSIILIFFYQDLLNQEEPLTNPKAPLHCTAGLLPSLDHRSDLYYHAVADRTHATDSLAAEQLRDLILSLTDIAAPSIIQLLNTALIERCREVKPLLQRLWSFAAKYACASCIDTRPLPKTALDVKIRLDQNKTWRGMRLPVISVHPKGRLGNLMGEYATLFALQKIYNVSAVLTPNFSTAIRTPFKGISMPTIEEYVENEWTEVPSDLHLKNYGYKGEQLAAAGLLGAKPFLFTDYPFEFFIFNAFREDIRRQFTFHANIMEKATAHLQKVSGSAKRDTNALPLTTVGVHVRLTDYPSHMDVVSSDNPSHIGVVSSDNPSHMDVVSSDNPSHMGVVSSDNPSHMGVVSSDNPSHMGVVSSDNPSHMGVVSSDNPSHMDVVSSDNPSHMDVVNSDKPSHMDVLFSVDDIAPSYASYLRRAAAHFLDRHSNVVFVVTSDDLTMTRNIFEQFHLKNVFVSQGSPEEDMCLLKLCNHNIVTFGSYSFWTGYLGHGTTVYPDLNITDLKYPHTRVYVAGTKVIINEPHSRVHLHAEQSNALVSEHTFKIINFATGDRDLRILECLPILYEKPVLNQTGSSNQLQVSVGSPVQSLGSPVQSLGSPVQSLGSPVQPVGLPVQSVALPVQFVGLPVLSVGLPEQSVALPVQFVGLPVQSVGLPV